MTDDPHGSLAARVLTAIERHPEGLPLEDLRERLRRNGRRPAAEAVAAALLDLQRADLAQIGTRRRWFPYRIPSPSAVRPTGDRQSPEASGPESSPQGSVLAAIPATPGLPRATPRAAPVPAGAEGQIEPSWALLRRLLPYYREALARNERALLLGEPARYGEQFLFLAPRGRWWPGEGETTTLDIARSALPPAFLTALARRTREPVHIAFPIALVRPSEATRPPVPGAGGDRGRRLDAG